MADDGLWWEERRWEDDGGISDTERCEWCRVHFIVDELIGINRDDGKPTEWVCMDCLNGMLQVEELSPHEQLAIEDKRDRG